MIKKFSVLALAAVIALPVTAMAGGGSADLGAKIDQLTKELNQLKQQMSQLKSDTQDVSDTLDEKSEKWDFASRFQLSGDFRTMLESVHAKVPEYYNALNVARGISVAAGSDANRNAYYVQHSLVPYFKTFTAAGRKAAFAGMGYSPNPATDYNDNAMWTNRLRINMRVKATENLEFKGRLAMYKVWGMESNPVDSSYDNFNGGGAFMLNSAMTGYDGGTTRQPQGNILRVDRAFINWNNIAGEPVWFSIGRRPTTDGPPAQLRLGADKRMATPVAFMDWPFDGLSVGYAYDSLFGMSDFPGRVRFCYGRGFDAGPGSDGNSDLNTTALNNVDFGGLSWDVYHKGNTFFNFQSFGAFNLFNVPDGVTFVNPLEYAFWEQDQKSGSPTGAFYDPLNPNKNLKLDRANLGNLYHTDVVYMSKYNNLNYFFAGGWSRTVGEGVDEMGTGLLTSWWDQPTTKDGYSFYTGVRYDLPNQPFKIGLEYNHGTKNWIALTPGNDDLYASKLATRGDVIEAYTIWDIPAGEKISRFSKAFIRLGYQYYKYDYTGSGFWLGAPVKIDDVAKDPLSAQFYAPVDHMSQFYLSLEAWF
ncbi:DUF3373 family protein [Desulfobacterota bacterium M19]